MSETPDLPAGATEPSGEPTAPGSAGERKASDPPASSSSAVRGSWSPRAFVAAAQAFDRDPAELLGLYPEEARFPVPPGGRGFGETLDEVLWAELEHLESQSPTHGDVEGRGRVQYYLRRRELGHRRRWETAATSLPRPWRRLAEQAAGVVRERCIDVGVHLVAAGGQGMSAAQLKTWLMPLGGPAARRVAERLVAQASAGPDPLTEMGREAYDAARASGRRHASILSRLGRRVLASLFLEIPEELRRDAGQIGRSNVLEILGGEQPLPIAEPAQRERVEELVRVALDFEG